LYAADACGFTSGKSLAEVIRSMCFLERMVICQRCGKGAGGGAALDKVFTTV
jgi:hypothetical protein